MFINPKNHNITPNQPLSIYRVNPYITGFILSYINTPSHISALIHIARHTFGSLQVEAGTSIYVVQKMLAHKNVETTQIYAAMADEQKRLSANRITLKPTGD